MTLEAVRASRQACQFFVSFPKCVLSQESYQIGYELFSEAIEQLEKCSQMLNGYEGHSEYPEIFEKIVTWQEAVEANMIRFLYLSQNPQELLDPNCYHIE